MGQSAFCAISMGSLKNAACDGDAGDGWWADAGLAAIVAAGLLILALALLLIARRQSRGADGALQERAREAERRRIGSDIHDDLGQHLLALKMDCCTLRRHLPADAAALHAQLDLINSHLDRALHSLRCVINALRPPDLRAGLGAALPALLAEFSRIHGLRHTLDLPADACAAAAPHELLLFRLMQEALSNVARHARAHSVAVALRLDTSRGELLLTVADDGIGLPAPGFPRGCGLDGMEERSAAAGGRFLASSEPGRGTMLSVALPLRAPRALQAAAVPA